jgi:hypothetical protein
VAGNADADDALHARLPRPVLLCKELGHSLTVLPVVAVGTDEPRVGEYRHRLRQHVAVVGIAGEHQRDGFIESARSEPLLEGGGKFGVCSTNASRLNGGFFIDAASRGHPYPRATVWNAKTPSHRGIRPICRQNGALTPWSAQTRSPDERL